MLNIGIIGCGRVAQTRHAIEYAANARCRIAACCAASAESAAAFRERWGGVACGSVDELLREDIDAVSVCVPNALHAKTAIAALRAGKHVLCEKPMACTAAECEAMVRETEKAGRMLMVAMSQRFFSAHIEAKRIIESGRLGEVRGFSTVFLHAGPDNRGRGRDTWFFEKERAHFGVMADLGVHKTDLIAYLTGQRIVETRAALCTLEKKKADGTPIDVEDNATADYTLENGAVGTMRVSWTHYGAMDNSTRIDLERGVMRLYDDPAYALIIEHRSGEVERIGFAKQEREGVVDAFVDGILSGTPPEPSGKTALDAMRVIFANAVSAAEGRAVAVEYGI